MSTARTIFGAAPPHFQTLQQNVLDHIGDTPLLRLERAGLPGDAVRRLTRLFETVRYGDKRSAPKDVSEAVNCLNTILHYCGETI